MSILESISMWGGIAGVAVAIFAVIILYLTRSNIIDLLDKDAIMYDKVYELKKTAMQNAFDVLDDFEIYGLEIRKSKQFIQKAKAVFNELMCTANSPKVYEDFYKLTLDENNQHITVKSIATFKSLCRADLGLHVRKDKHKKVDNSAEVSQISSIDSDSAPVQRPIPERPVERPVPAERPTQVAGGSRVAQARPRPVAPNARPMPRPQPVKKEEPEDEE